MKDIRNKELIDEIIKLIQSNPNDQELGAKIRKLFNDGKDII